MGERALRVRGRKGCIAMSLREWGWSVFWEERFASFQQQGLAAARVAGGSHGIYELEMESGRQRGELSGRLEYSALSALDLPAVGDWVAVTTTDPALIVSVVERRSLFARTLESGERQALAANLDIAFLVTGLDGDFNLRRLDRYRVLAEDAGVPTVIVLNKRDLCPDVDAVLRSVSQMGPAVAISAFADDAGALLGAHVPPGGTAALLGSSGVGKSTLVNALFRESVQTTKAVREWDCRGRHTTTARSLFRLPAGWLLVDMPGIRTVGVAGAGNAVPDAFEDIAALAKQCRFSDCRHAGEPGCAVKGAVDAGRLYSYGKLLKEAAYQHRKEDPAAARALKEEWKRIHSTMRKRIDKRS